MKRHGGIKGQTQKVCFLGVSILRGVYSLLAAFEREAGVTGPHVNFFCKGCSMMLNGLFLNSSVVEMLEKRITRSGYIISNYRDLY